MHVSRLALLLVIPLGCSRAREFVSQAPAEPSATTTAITTTPAPVTNGGLAFRGAEGFGARAAGGRGGAICRVTTLAKGGHGSLQACFDAEGPRTVVFDVSGTIEGPLEIKHGRLTVAGQTSPGGIAVKGGVVCDNVYDPNDCNDVIVRHVRFRGGNPDSFRIGGAHDVILDHCSFAGAEDENIEITRSRDVTVQWSVVAEPRGEHYKWGGVLLNYSKDVMPLDRITIHHTVWNGVAGRLPEITCEDNGDGPGKSNCTGHVLSLELTNNVLFDASDPIWFNRCPGNNQGNDCPAGAPTTFALKLNLVGNVLLRRGTVDEAPLAEPAIFQGRNQVFQSDNAIMRGAARSSVTERSVPARHPFPAVTTRPSSEIVALLAKSAGPFPRDAMDTRLASYLSRGVDARPAAWRNGQGIDVGDPFPRPTTEKPASDTDGDGIPDAWEKTHGLDASKAADGAAVGAAKGCATNVTSLECYLDDLADQKTPRSTVHE